MIITRDTLHAFQPKIRNQWLKDHPNPEDDDRLYAALNYKPKSTLRPRKRQGYVYFIQCNEFTKIGCTDDVKYRLTTLSCASPYTLTLLRVIETPEMHSTEQAIHSHLKPFHHAREWFLIPQQSLNHLLSLPNQHFLQMTYHFKTNQTLQLMKHSELYQK